MSKREADLDGIKYYYDPTVGSRGRRGCTIYLVPCAKCGEMVKRKTYGRNSIVLCDSCKLKEEKQKEAVAEAWFDIIETKAERRFNKALDEIQAQVKNFSEYEEAVKVARKAIDKYGSVPEAMVAVELLRLKYKIIPQQKVGKYKVDFYVPEDKFVVEVDGELFHRDNRHPNREATVQLSLGLDVKIIHVPAELIRKDIRKLGECIDKFLKMP